MSHTSGPASADNGARINNARIVAEYFNRDSNKWARILPSALTEVLSDSYTQRQASLFDDFKAKNIWMKSSERSDPWIHLDDGTDMFTYGVLGGVRTPPQISHISPILVPARIQKIDASEEALRYFGVAQFEIENEEPQIQSVFHSFGVNTLEGIDSWPHWNDVSYRNISCPISELSEDDLHWKAGVQAKINMDTALPMAIKAKVAGSRAYDSKAEETADDIDTKAMLRKCIKRINGPFLDPLTVRSVVRPYAYNCIDFSFSGTSEDIKKIIINPEHKEFGFSPKARLTQLRVQLPIKSLVSQPLLQALGMLRNVSTRFTIPKNELRLISGYQG